MKMVRRNDLTVYLKNSAGLRLIAAAALSFGGVWALPWMLGAVDDKLGYTNSIITVFLFLGFFGWLNKIFKAGFSGKGGRWFWPGFFGTGFSVCMVFGTRLDTAGSVPFGSGGMWISILVLSVIFTLTVRYFWDMPALWGFAKGGAAQGKGRERRSLLITAGVILLCYIPVFLAVYPGFFVYDAQDEYIQVVTRSFSTHHPLLHVLLLGGTIQLLFKLTGSCNLGIACYTVMQMTAMSVIFAWCVEKMKSRGAPKWVRILLTLYFGLCPVLVMFSLCSAKDGLFTGMLLITVALLQDLCGDAERFFEKKSGVLLLAASSLGMMLLRHNGFYAFIVFSPMLAFYLRRNLKRAVIYLGMVIGAYTLISTGLAKLLHADASENQEFLTVPVSQLARVYNDGKNSFSSPGEGNAAGEGALSVQDQETLYRYLPREAVERYTPKVSDGVKIDFNNEAFAADRAGFFRLWAKWGLAHPFTYLNAWFMTSYGYWYPDTVIDVYRGNTVFTYTYEDSSYFGYEVEEPGTRESKLPWLDELYRRMSLEIAQQKIPVISMLFSPGFLFWVTAFGLGFLCYRRSWSRVMPFVLPGLCWLTVILGPTYLVRYVVFLWAELPLLLWEVFMEIREFDNWK